jgi:hypothetical protein
VTTLYYTTSVGGGKGPRWRALPPPPCCRESNQTGEPTRTPPAPDARDAPQKARQRPPATGAPSNPRRAGGERRTAGTRHGPRAHLWTGTRPRAPATDTTTEAATGTPATALEDHGQPGARRGGASRKFDARSGCRGSNPATVTSWRTKTTGEPGRRRSGDGGDAPAPPAELEREPAAVTWSTPRRSEVAAVASWAETKRGDTGDRDSGDTNPSVPEP